MTFELVFGAEENQAKRTGSERLQVQMNPLDVPITEMFPTVDFVAIITFENSVVVNNFVVFLEQKLVFKILQTNGTDEVQ